MVGRLSSRYVLVAGAAAGVAGLLHPSSAAAQTISYFNPGDLVVSVEGNGVVGGNGAYIDNQAAPLTLFQYATNGTSSASYAGSLVLPQTASGANSAISGEYGSSSEGTLQLSGNGQYLSIMGYGINAGTFNAGPGTYSPTPGNTALGQSGSQTGQSYTPVSRVVGLIGANATIDTTTALNNVFNTNNPRSVYTANGTSFYVSGQGSGGDNTGGVFYTTLGSSSTTSITGNDAGGGASQDTREVQIANNQLTVSTDSKSGTTNRSYIGTLGPVGAAPTSVANGGNGPAMLTGFGNTGGTGKVTITSGNGNGINSAGQQINLSPENFVFAASGTILYVADSGSGKQTSGTSTLGDGGLQKWSLVSGSWVLDYTLSAGLNLVANQASKPTDTAGTTGLYGLTGEEVNVGGVEEEELFATNATIGDLDPTFLYGITDVLSATKLPNGAQAESFDQLAIAPADSNFKGVAFAPVPEPGSMAVIASALFGLGLVRRRRRG